MLEVIHFTATSLNAFLDGKVNPFVARIQSKITALNESESIQNHISIIQIYASISKLAVSKNLPQAMITMIIIIVQQLKNNQRCDVKRRTYTNMTSPRFEYAGMALAIVANPYE